MLLGLPNNIYCRGLSSVLSEHDGIEVKFYPSAIVAEKLEVGEVDAAFIPSLYLLKNEELHISSKVGLSFEGLGSTSFLVLQNVPEAGKPDISLIGDHSMQEALLGKIILNELYELDARFHIKNADEGLKDKNIILAGDIAYHSGKFKEALSFSEEVVELSELPYLNFVLASMAASTGSKAEEILISVTERFYDAMEGDDLFGFDETSRAFVRENMQSTIFDIDEADIEGLNNLLRMVFYKGLSEDIRELKFFNPPIQK